MFWSKDYKLSKHTHTSQLIHVYLQQHYSKINNFKQKTSKSEIKHVLQSSAPDVR